MTEEINIHDLIDDFAFLPDNNMDDITGKEFIIRFEVLIESLKITDKQLNEWLTWTWEFQADNTTFSFGPERERIRNYIEDKLGL